MITIIGVRKWNGFIQQKFEPHMKRVKDESSMRNYGFLIEDEMSCDFAYREKVSRSELKAIYQELGISLKTQRKNKIKANEKRS